MQNAQNDTKAVSVDSKKEAPKFSLNVKKKVVQNNRRALGALVK